ncbi:unnamed protein product [Tilletia controversa]|nr:unnamed protein product [Tilletia controversa]
MILVPADLLPTPRNAASPQLCGTPTPRHLNQPFRLRSQSDRQSITLHEDHGRLIRVAAGHSWATPTSSPYAHGRRTSDAGSGPNNIPKAPDEYSGINVEDGLNPPSPTPYNFFAQQKTAATIFLIGGNFPANPDAIKQAQFLYGADLGFHAWYHTVQTPLSNENIVAELGWRVRPRQRTASSAAALPEVTVFAPQPIPTLVPRATQEGVPPAAAATSSKPKTDSNKPVGPVACCPASTPVPPAASQADPDSQSPHTSSSHHHQPRLLLHMLVSAIHPLQAVERQTKRATNLTALWRPPSLLCPLASSRRPLRHPVWPPAPEAQPPSAASPKQMPASGWTPEQEKKPRPPWPVAPEASAAISDALDPFEELEAKFSRISHFPRTAFSVLDI